MFIVYREDVNHVYARCRKLSRAVEWIRRENRRIKSVPGYSTAWFPAEVLHEDFSAVSQDEWDAFNQEDEATENY